MLSKLSNVRAQEDEARDIYRKTIEPQEGGYDDLLTELLGEKERSFSQTTQEKNTALQELLESKISGDEQQRDLYGEGISEFLRGEEQKQARTGFKRDTETDISDISKQYIPEMERSIEGYRQKTGETYAGAIEGIGEASQKYEEGITDVYQGASDAWKTLQESIGGGVSSGYQGSDIYTDLGDQYTTLLSQLTDIESGNRYSTDAWWM